MMKRTLVVMRHAKTEEQKPGQKDYDRNLTERGRNDAMLMATILKEKGIMPKIIIASSANRTIQTAEIVAKTLNYEIDKIQLSQTLYMSDSRRLANTVEALDVDIESCLIIAHNPGISEFAFDLNRASISSSLPTSGLVVYSFLAHTWEDLFMVKNKIELFEYPKK
jgi:phosphohistidine phosphatase